MIKKLLPLLLFAVPCFGQTAAFYQLPQPLPNASVRVCPVPAVGNPCASPSSIFSDSGLTQGISNPFPVGSSGNFGFWIAAGQYTIQIASPYNQVYVITLGSGGSAGSGTVNTGTTGALAFYPSASAAVSPTGAATVGAGQSVVSSGTGQLAANGEWLNTATGAIFPGTPTLTAALTGGAISTGTNVYVRLTFVGPATIIPSAEVLIQMNTTTGCASGSICSVTVTMPTNCTAGNLPAGVTGCTVWDTITNVNQEKQQTASNACVNITTATCVIGTVAVGSNLSATVSATAGLTPPSPVTTGTPDLIIPLEWATAANGSSYPLAGLDTSALNFLGCCWTSFAVTGPSKGGTNGGVYTIVDNLFVNDDINPPPISNSMVSFKHESGASTATKTTSGGGLDDRAFAIRIDNDLTTNPNYEQYLAQYNEAFADNNSTTCAPIAFGTPYGESCVAAGRFIGEDVRAAGTQPLIFEGVHGNAGNTFTPVAGSGAAVSFVGVTGGAAQGPSATNGNGNTWVGGWFGFNGSTGNTSSSGYGVKIEAPGTRMASLDIGLGISAYSNNALDWNILSIGTPSGASGGTGRNLLEGSTWLSQLVASSSTINVLGSIGATGGLATLQLTAPTIGSATPQGTSGATTSTYKATCVDVNGNETTSSAAVNTNAANANITPTNNVLITMVTNQSQAGCTSFNIYRTVNAAQCNGIACTNGKIGNAISGPMNAAENATSQFTDTGQVGDGNTTVTQPNLTGGAALAGYIKQLGAVRTTAAFTTAANTNLQTITGLSWNLPNVAQNYAFHCAGFYSQATGLAAVSFGIQAATNAPTNINATGTMYTGATAVQDGVLAGLATTTATNIVSSTPAGTGVNTTFYLDGTIENPAAINTINIMVSTAASADAVTVGRGTTCQLWITGN